MPKMEMEELQCDAGSMTYTSERECALITVTASERRFTWLDRLMTRSITDAFWSNGFYLKEGDKKKNLPTLAQQGILERLTLKDILFRAGSIAVLYMDRLQLYKSNWKWP